MTSIAIQLVRQFSSSLNTPPAPIVARHLGLILDSAVPMAVLHLEDAQQRTVESMRGFGRPEQPLTEEVLDLVTGLEHSVT